MLYNETKLWKSAFSESQEITKEITDELKREYETMRGRVSHILERIREDFPRLTLHDISHADKLWEIGSIITGPDYPINAYEGFVLGGAFLLHDAALSFDSVDGKEALQSTEIWKGFASLCRQNKWVSEEFVEDEADFYAIRKLHADRAEALATEKITIESGVKDYIIQNNYYRTRLGPLIGSIAASHHWPIERLHELDSTFTIGGCFINAQKIACILRCADAAHIDDSRAPDYLFNVLKLNRVSYSHWCAQNRLALIVEDPTQKGSLMIKSTMPFVEDDFDAWNVAYDAACVIDREIRDSNTHLESMTPSCSTFFAKGISGVESREKFSNYVKAQDWSPSDCNVHISKIADLISSLGGEKLYGKDNKLLIVLRELIQNARDAVVARMELEKDPAYQGRVLVSFEKEGKDVYCSVADNGVGMSNRTLTTSFLDFGSSFWSSSDSLSEFPSLHSTNFSSVGQFGIGFFSVFMVASAVTVNSRKYGDGLDANVEIKFPRGLTLSPIVRHIVGKSPLYSTVVRFKISKGLTGIREWEKGVVLDGNLRAPFWNKISRLTAGLDVNVYYSTSRNPKEILVHQSVNDLGFDKKKWLQDITSSQFRKEPLLIEYIDQCCDKLQMIKDGNRVIGLATLALPPKSICSDTSIFRLRTIGGLLVDDFLYDGYVYVGYLDFLPNSIKRDADAKAVVSSSSLKQWALQQKELILKSRPFRSKDELVSKYLPVILGQHRVNSLDFAKILLYDPGSDSEGFYSLDEVYQLMQDGKIIIYSTRAEGGKQPTFETPYEENRNFMIIYKNDTFYSGFHIDEFSVYSPFYHVEQFLKRKGIKLENKDLGLVSYEKKGQRWRHPAHGWCIKVPQSL